MDLDTLREYFVKKHNAPPGSGVYSTPNAYLNDETWRNIAPAFCEGIFMMHVVRYYPDWWTVVTLYGFASHLYPAALLILSKHKIILIKEEGDTSQACHPYNQQVAKQDNLQQRQILVKLRITTKCVIDQYSLVLITNHALNKIIGHV